jgi:hypothetical protein
VTATLSSPVEHDDLHEISVELVSSAYGMEVSPVQIDQHVVRMMTCIQVPLLALS